MFVYGTLRSGGWNHERWLAPRLVALPEPARLGGYTLHAHSGLPYVVAGGEGDVVGELATVDGDAVAVLDELEGVASGHYDRVAVAVGAVEAWLYVAGRRVAPSLGPDTVVDGGDWFSARR